MARLRYLQNARTGTAGTISKDTKPIQFYDDDMYIYASADGVLEIVSDTTLNLTAPTITLTGSTALDLSGTLSDMLSIGTRTASTALSISTGGALTGLNVGVVYDAAGVANTTDYIGTAGIFNYIHGVECKSGGNVTSGMATIWANYEIDYQVYGSGGLSAGWFTIWADAAGDAAHIRSSAGARALHLQGVDIALVSGSAFDLGTNCDLFGLRIDSSIDGSATLTGHFYGINIARSSTGKADWQIGIDINDSTIGLQVATCTTGIYVTGVFTNGISIINAAATTSGRTGILVADTCAKTDGGVHKGISSTVTYTPADSGYSTPIGVVGKVTLTGSDTFSDGAGAMYGVQGQLDLATSCILDNNQGIFAGLRGVVTGTTPVLTDASVVACCYLDYLCTTNLAGTAQYGASLLSIANHGGTLDHGIQIYGNNKLTNVFAFYTCEDAISQNASSTGGIGYKMKVLLDGNTYYINLYPNV